MKQYYHIVLLLLAASLFTGCKEENYQVTLKQDVISQVDTLESRITDFIAVAGKTESAAELQQHFRQSKLQYKKLEWAVEYFIPETARFMNGPALDELELEENREFPPHGFQVVEELIYHAYHKESKPELLRELTLLLSNTRQIRNHLQAVTISPDYVIDATRLQVYRIISLGITGFDSPIALSSIPEAKASLQSIPGIIGKVKNNTDSASVEKTLIKLVDKAVNYCDINKDFNSFNRAEFITEYLNPISKKLAEFQKIENIKEVPRTRALRANAEYLFAENAFDADAFIPSSEYKYSTEKAALGEMLFYDNSLSKNNDRNCATCHNPEKAFTDGMKVNTSITGIGLKRNTSTLTYASLQNGQFWDLRQPDLERQSVDVIENREEMHGSMTVIVSRITKDKKYRDRFKKVFKTDKTEAWQVQNAIASYVRSLNAFDSRFDEYMRGNKNSLTADEIKGMNLYMGKAKCATCHFTPLFNGTVPPNFVKTEHEVIGTPKDVAGTQLSDDMGRYIFNQMPQLKHAYKTPGLRNVAVTAPYMHNGVYSTLEQVVDFYNKGGGTGIGLPADNQTLPGDKLNLSPKEIKELIAFMKTLTDKKYDK
jgi:cytochrome c peroxidase